MPFYLRAYTVSITICLLALSLTRPDHVHAQDQGGSHCSDGSLVCLEETTAVETPAAAAAAEATDQPQERPRSRARTGQVEVVVQVDGTNGGEGSGARGGIDVVRDGTGGGFDGVSAWMMGLAEEGVFRRIVGFL